MNNLCTSIYMQLSNVSLSWFPRVFKKWPLIRRSYHESHASPSQLHESRTNKGQAKKE